jgi:WD40 repeat protein
MRGRQPEPFVTLRGHEDDVTAISFFLRAPPFQNDTRFLLSGDASGCVRVWNTHIAESILDVPASSSHRSPVLAIEQDPELDVLYVQHKCGTVRSVVLSHNPFKAGGSFFDATMASACEIPDSFCAIKLLRRGVIVGPGGAIDAEGAGSAMVLRDSRAGGDMPVTSRFLEDGSPRGMLMCVSLLSSSGEEESAQRVAAGYEDGSVAVWDIRAYLRPLSSVKASSESVLSIDSSPRGGGIVVVGSASNEIVATLDDKVISRQRLRAAGISCLRWRGDGRVIASAGWDGRVRFWDGQRSQHFLRKLGSLSWHGEGGAQALAFCNDMQTIASGGRDRTLALWKCFAQKEDRASGRDGADLSIVRAGASDARA